MFTTTRYCNLPKKAGTNKEKMRTALYHPLKAKYIKDHILNNLKLCNVANLYVRSLQYTRNHEVNTTTSTVHSIQPVLFSTKCN